MLGRGGKESSPFCVSDSSTRIDPLVSRWRGENFESTERMGKNSKIDPFEIQLVKAIARGALIVQRTKIDISAKIIRATPAAQN